MRVSARARDATQALARLPEVREDRRLNEFRQKHEEGPQPLAHGVVGRAPVDEKLKDPVREAEEPRAAQGEDVMRREEFRDDLHVLHQL